MGIASQLITWTWISVFQPLHNFFLLVFSSPTRRDTVVRRQLRSSLMMRNGFHQLHLCAYIPCDQITQLIKGQWHSTEFHCCFPPKRPLMSFQRENLSPVIHTYPVRFYQLTTRHGPPSGLATYSLSPPHFYYATVSGSTARALCVQ